WSGTATSVAPRQNICAHAATPLRKKRGVTNRAGGTNAAMFFLDTTRERDTTANRTRLATPVEASTPTAHSGTSPSGPSAAADIYNATPTVNDSAPGQCRREGCGNARGTNAIRAATSSALTGTRIQKTPRQPSGCDSRPPSGGPSAWPMPLAAAQAPIVLVRRAGS